MLPHAPPTPDATVPTGAAPCVKTRIASNAERSTITVNYVRTYYRGPTFAFEYGSKPIWSTRSRLHAEVLAVARKLTAS